MPARAARSFKIVESDDRHQAVHVILGTVADTIVGSMILLDRGAERAVHDRELLQGFGSRVSIDRRDRLRLYAKQGLRARQRCQASPKWLPAG